MGARKGRAGDGAEGGVEADARAGHEPGGQLAGKADAHEDGGIDAARIAAEEEGVAGAAILAGEADDDPLDGRSREPVVEARRGDLCAAPVCGEQPQCEQQGGADGKQPSSRGQQKAEAGGAERQQQHRLALVVEGQQEP